MNAPAGPTPNRTPTNSAARAFAALAPERDLSARVFGSVFDMLPDEANPSPMVRINRLAPADPARFPLYAKLEWMNPFGSVKDRAAWEMIRDLEARGVVGPASPDRNLVEPTSGNTGISLAALASVRGYGLRAIVPSKVPEEKRVLLKVAGAQLDVVNDQMCPSPAHSASGGGEGSINLAKSYARADADHYAIPNQYENRANVQAHIRTTGPEIWRQTGGRITHLFTSLGTCGTVTGCATYLKSKNPNIKVIAVQPSPGHDVPGLRNTSELDVSKLFDRSLIDEIVEIPFELAYDRALDLARHEGLFAGPSSGLIFEGCCRVMQRTPDAPGLAVAIFCDNVFKYVSSMLRHHPELAGE
jgi:cysteine synthase